jgi:hypothetical protein
MIAPPQIRRYEVLVVGADPSLPRTPAGLTGLAPDSHDSEPNGGPDDR